MTPAAESTVERFAAAPAFLEAAGDFLAEREAEHNLIFGICANLRADPGFPSAPPYLAAVSDGGRVIATGVMTPPWNIVLSCVDDPDGFTALAADLDAVGAASNKIYQQIGYEPVIDVDQIAFEPAGQARKPARQA